MKTEHIYECQNDEILQKLGNKAPKSYSDFKSLSSSEKESLRQDNKVASYVWSSTKEKLTDKQKDILKILTAISQSNLVVLKTEMLRDFV